MRVRQSGEQKGEISLTPFGQLLRTGDVIKPDQHESCHLLKRACLVLIILGSSTFLQSVIVKGLSSAVCSVTFFIVQFRANSMSPASYALSVTFTQFRLVISFFHRPTPQNTP